MAWEKLQPHETTDVQGVKLANALDGAPFTEDVLDGIFNANPPLSGSNGVVSVKGIGGDGLARQFVGPEADIRPLIDDLDSGVEYSWSKTDGAGTLLDLVTGVA